MDRPQQQVTCTARQSWPSYETFAGSLGISLLLVLSGCAQLDQLMGGQTGSPESAQSAQTAEPASVAPASASHPAQATEPVSKSTAKKKAAESHPSSLTPEQYHQAPTPHTAPAAGVAKQPESASKPSEQDKALSESDQQKKEKKSRAASDKKSKKSLKPHSESPLQAEDVFLPPVPLPSKPASIGGSGG